MDKPKKKYWYKFFWRECPVCGRSDASYKVRMYTPKPVDARKRHIYQQRYDYCMERGGW